MILGCYPVDFIRILTRDNILLPIINPLNENLNVNVDNADATRKKKLEKLTLFRERPKPSTDSEFSSQLDIFY